MLIIFKDLKQIIHKNLNDMDFTTQKNRSILIINGQSLNNALSTDLKIDFLKLCIKCKAIICCRISSTQKSKVINFFKIQMGIDFKAINYKLLLILL